MSTTIILTSTVNVNPNKRYMEQKDKNERLNAYIKSILQWLQKTKLNIVLVENSGHDFDELNQEKKLYKDRFEVITFNELDIEEAKYLENNDSKGDSELFAIDYAFRNSKLILIKQPIFIIKITCRFFIPELENYLSNYDLNAYDCLTQNDRDRCEMVGTHINHFSQIFAPSSGEFLTEAVWKRRTSSFENVLVCKRFDIEGTLRGGLNQTLVDI